jgi:N-acetylneuraminate 9-O-acetyltransferase
MIKDKQMNRVENILQQWKGRKDFLWAQLHMTGIIVVALIGNNWPVSYHRNENHNPSMFWVANIALGIAAYMTLKHDVQESARGVQLLSRAQTEEWKGWMQWAFVMVCGLLIV